MIKLLTLLTLCSIVLSACDKSDCNRDTPQCILDKIEAIKAEPVQNPAASIYEYEYNGQTVYFIPAACCDFMSELYDSQCNLICHPDGGIAGNGDGNCTDFFTERKKEKLIWKDPR